MELIISYPATEDRIKLFQTKLIMKCIDDLNIDDISKKKILNGIETIKTESKKPIEINNQ